MDVNENSDHTPGRETTPLTEDEILRKLREIQESHHFNELYSDSGWYGAQILNPVKLVDLDSLSSLHIMRASTACNRTAPVFLVPDAWAHWLTSAVLVEELLCYTYERWFLPYRSHIDRGQFLTKVCTVPNAPPPPQEACSEEMVNYIKNWSANLCARVEYSQAHHMDFDEERAGERLYYIRPLFRAVALAIRFSAFNLHVSDISTIPVLIVRTGVEDDLSASVFLEEIPNSHRLQVVADSQGRLSAVSTTLSAAITFLMALEERERSDGAPAMDMVKSTRPMRSFLVNTAVEYAKSLGWDEERMGSVKGPSCSWLGEMEPPVWSGEGYKTFQHHRNLCVRRRESAKPIWDVMQDPVSWDRHLREQ